MNTLEPKFLDMVLKNLSQSKTENKPSKKSKHAEINSNYNNLNFATGLTVSSFT